MENELKSLQTKLDHISDKLVARKRATEYLKECRVLMDKLEDDRKALFLILKKEEADVNKLEAMSVNMLFRHFLKNTELQLEIEQQEYVVAALKYNECIDAIDLLHYEVRVLENLIAEEPNIQQKYDALLLKKELAVKEVYPDIASQIYNIDYKITRRRIELKEIDEALVAGMRAETKLLSINNLLKKVDNWGTFNTGQYVSQYSKSSYVDKALKLATETKLLLTRFETELKDVFKNLNVKNDLTLDAFEHFLNIFYDNMITDWIVQSQLRHTQNSMEATTAKVGRLIASLKREKAQFQKSVHDLHQQRKNYITTSL